MIYPLMNHQIFFSLDKHAGKIFKVLHRYVQQSQGRKKILSFPFPSQFFCKKSKKKQIMGNLTCKNLLCVGWPINSSTFCRSITRLWGHQKIEPWVCPLYQVINYQLINIVKKVSVYCLCYSSPAYNSYWVQFCTVLSLYAYYFFHVVLARARGQSSWILSSLVTQKSWREKVLQ